MISWIFGQGKSSKTGGSSANSQNVTILVTLPTETMILPSTQIWATRQRITLLKTRKTMTMKTVQKKPTRHLLPTVLFPHKSPDSRPSDPLQALQTRTICAGFSRQRRFDANSMAETTLPKRNSAFYPHVRLLRNERWLRLGRPNSQRERNHGHSKPQHPVPNLKTSLRFRTPIETTSTMDIVLVGHLVLKSHLQYLHHLPPHRPRGPLLRFLSLPLRYCHAHHFTPTGDLRLGDFSDPPPPNGGRSPPPLGEHLKIVSTRLT